MIVLVFVAMYLACLYLTVKFYSLIEAWIDKKFF